MINKSSCLNYFIFSLCEFKNYDAKKQTKRKFLNFNMCK